MSLPDVVREYGQAFRGDWSSIDGRSVRDEMADLAGWISDPTAYPGDLAVRQSWGICRTGGGHWDQYCEDYYCELVLSEGVTHD